MNKYPIKLQAVSKQIIWGGDRLKKEYNKKADFDKIAESWELTSRNDGMNVIENGEFAGMTLETYAALDKKEVLGTACCDADRFPLLIKFIDAHDNLSIQVHPDDEYGLKNENEYGKTEMWYIMDCEEGAKLVYGLKPGITVEAFAKAVEDDEIESTLNYVPVKKGDVYFIPAGQVHAIGSGILIAEIQQNSNVTYRVYDYKRRGADGSLRPLHTKKAIDVINLRNEDEINALRYSNAAAESDSTLLASCKYFDVHKISGNTTVSVDEKSFVSVLVLDAEEGAEIVYNGVSYPIAKGDSYFLSAGMGDVAVNGGEIITSKVN